MAYTSERTWVTAETVTAAIMNQHVRDNFAATAPGIATGTGSLIVTDGTNSVVERVPLQDVDNGNGTGTNTSYLSLANLTGGSAFAGEVEVAVTTGTRAIVQWAAQLQTTTAGAHVLLSYSVSGATTTAADDNFALQYESGSASDLAQFGTFHLATVTAGSNTFTLEAKASAGTMTIGEPRILVIPL